MLNSRLDLMASRVRLGVAMLNETSGVGDNVNDVNDDMVMARGVPLCVAVHTTMGFVKSRSTERICSGRAVSASGFVVGPLGDETFHDSVEADVWKFLDNEPAFQLSDTVIQSVQLCVGETYV